MEGLVKFREALELGNKKIDELRKEINNINIQMIKFSLLGETILEWNDKNIEHYPFFIKKWSCYPIYTCFAFF